jgi:hypothetical protein
MRKTAARDEWRGISRRKGGSEEEIKAAGAADEGGSRPIENRKEKIEKRK